MKVLDKIGLALFSTIVLIISVIICVLIFGWLNLADVNALMQAMLNDQASCNIVLAVAVICMLLAIKCIFFESTPKEQKEMGDGVLLENENGKLIISKNTIQNLVTGVVKEFESATDASSSVRANKEGTLEIDVTIYADSNAIIKDLSTNLQNKVKEIIKKSLDIDVKSVNIKVKDVTPKQSNKEA